MRPIAHGRPVWPGRRITYDSVGIERHTFPRFAPCPVPSSIPLRRPSQHTKNGFQRGNQRTAAANVQAVMHVRLFPRCARRTRAVSAAIGRFDRTRITQAHSKRPLQLLPLLRMSQPEQSDHSSRNAKDTPLPTYVSSTLPSRLLRFARMRRCTGPCQRLRCGAGCRRCRFADLSVRGPRPSRSGCSRLCSAHARRTCTPPIMWHFHSRSTRSMHRLGCCMQPAVMESTDAPLASASASSCFHSLLLLQCPPNRPVLLTHHRPHVRDSAAETVLAPLRW